MSVATRPIGCYVAELIAAYGVDTVFGIPGVHTLELYRGLARETRLRHVLTRHEQGAGFAADGYARASGRPAALFVISGPGLTNALTAIGQAYSDSVPMLVVASTPPRASLGRRWGVLHELEDQHRVISGVLDLTCTARSAEEIRDFIATAFAALRSGRPRPAYLGIPLDLLAETTALPAEVREPATPPRPIDAAALQSAADLLNAARQPAIIAGGGARAAAAELRALVERVDGYLATTASGKGILPEAHRSNLGCSLPFAPTQQRLLESDVVLAVGTQITETDVYTSHRLPLGGKLIRIDLEPTRNDLYPATVSIQADAATALAALLPRVAARSGWCTAAGDASRHRAGIDAQFDAPSRLRRAALAAIRAAMPTDGQLFTDMTQIAYLGNYAYATDAPGLWHHPSGYGTLGYAFPAALGGQLAAPRRAVAALMGDFGLQYTLAELATAVELGLSLPLIVWNNGALGQIKDDMLAAGIPPVGVVAQNPDFMALARACGAEGVVVTSAAELTAAVAAALGRGLPTLIEIDAARFYAV